MEILEILEMILKDRVNRVQLIKKFQGLMWNDEKSDETLSELAYDLDFYEPDTELRKQDINYYGDERLEEEIKLAIQKIKEKNT
jgi:hypothetical protein